MTSVKAKIIKLSDSRPSSFIELPAGVHIIGDKKYTVVEIQEPSFDGTQMFKRRAGFTKKAKT